MFSINPARPVWIAPVPSLAWQREKAEGERQSVLLPSQGQCCHGWEACYIAAVQSIFPFPD